MLFLVFSIFIFSQEIRTGILGESLGRINWIAIVLIFNLLYIIIKRSNNTIYVLFYITIIIYILCASIYENDIMTLIKCILVFFVPLLLIGVELNEEETKYLLIKLVKILNIITITITFIGISESILGININFAFVSILPSSLSSKMLAQQGRDVYRLYSFMGHPLFNTQLYLMFFILNNILDNYIYKKKSKIWVLIISILGMSLTASKTGIILIFISAIFLFKGYKKEIKIVTFILILIAGFKVGIFDDVITRFMGNSLTSGRTEVWERINDLNLFPLKFFKGYGSGFTFKVNEYVQSGSAAYEYPFRMFSLELGILTAILIYIFIFIIPVLKLILNKSWYFLMCFIIIFIDVNTYNGLALKGDFMLIFCLYSLIIINLSKIEKKE